MLENLNAATGSALSVCALLAVVASWMKWIRPHIRKTREDGVAIRDAILGRDPIIDSITKKEIAPALPGIGQRMATVEQALVTFAQNQHDLEELRSRVDGHDARIEALETGTVERVVTKVESAAAWRAMEAAVLATPDEEGEAE